MLNSQFIDKLIELALVEDSYFGDVTSQLTIDDKKLSKAVIIAKEDFVVCGLNLIERIVALSNFNVSVKLNASDGDEVKKTRTLAELKGKTKDILTLERVILNFLQKLSGIATNTREFVKAAKPILVYDTRKTTPGFRVLEKYAVSIGGAKNHRFSLSDMILIKNNHVDNSKLNITEIIQALKDKVPLATKIEVEVRDLKELKLALLGEPNIIMFDNFSDALIKEAFEIVSASSKKPFIEISGQIDLKRLAALKKLKVKAVSTSSLVTKAKWVDISMKIF